MKIDERNLKVMRYMENTTIYPRTKEYIINTLYDIIELQNGKLILSDAVRGIVYYKVSMYGYEWELMYTVTEIQGQTRWSAPDGPGSREGKSSVTIRIIGERRENEKEMRRALALLESMLNL